MRVNVHRPKHPPPLSLPPSFPPSLPPSLPPAYCTQNKHSRLEEFAKSASNTTFGKLAGLWGHQQRERYARKEPSPPSATPLNLSLLSPSLFLLSPSSHPPSSPLLPPLLPPPSPPPLPPLPLPLPLPPPLLPSSQRSEVLGVFRQQLCRELQVLETEVMRTQKSEEKAICLLQEQMKIHTSSCKTQQKQ